MGEESKDNQHVNVPYSRPAYIGDIRESKLGEALLTTVSAGILSKGPYARQLAAKIAHDTGYRLGVPFSSCTQALYALAEWYAGAFLVVEVPAFTWVSTIRPWLDIVGYADEYSNVVFADSDEKTWQTSPAATERDVAVGVDTFGSVNPDSQNFHVMDSAQSLGAKWNTMKPHRVISLSPSKIVTAGEGGILLTQDGYLAEFAEERASWAARMPETCAIVGMAYYERLKEFRAKKDEIDKAYREKFPNLRWQEIPVDSNHHTVAALVRDPKRVMMDNPTWEFKRYYQNEHVSLLPVSSFLSRHMLCFPAFVDFPLQALDELKLDEKEQAI